MAVRLCGCAAHAPARSCFRFHGCDCGWGLIAWLLAVLALAHLSPSSTMCVCVFVSVFVCVCVSACLCVCVCDRCNWLSHRVKEQLWV